MGRHDGKVVLITGAARGQGRSHAVTFAEQGADVIAVDICEQLDDVEYPMATPEDLKETVRLVEDQDRRILARQCDVRDRAALDAIVEVGLAELGRIDYVVANAGVMPVTLEVAGQDSAWHVGIDVMLTGVFNTVQAVVPSMIDRGAGGCIVITSSTAGFKGLMSGTSTMTPGQLGYVASKHGVVGLMRAYAQALASHRIRVNTVHPTGVSSPMILNEAFPRWIAEHPEVGKSFQNLLPVELVEPVDISHAIVWLCSEEARYVTGVTLPVDAGFTIR